MSQRASGIHLAGGRGDEALCPELGARWPSPGDRCPGPRLWRAFRPLHLSGRGAYQPGVHVGALDDRGHGRSPGVRGRVPDRFDEVFSRMWAALLAALAPAGARPTALSLWP